MVYVLTLFPLAFPFQIRIHFLLNSSKVCHSNLPPRNLAKKVAKKVLHFHIISTNVSSVHLHLNELSNTITRQFNEKLGSTRVRNPNELQKMSVNKKI